MVSTLEMVPSSSTGNFEGVKNAVRRFFLRSDTDNRGWVSEERFRAFLRRSSLADKMTSGELRRMTESLVQRHIVKSPSGVSATQNEGDYEKLITLMEAASETGRRRRRRRKKGASTAGTESMGGDLRI